jgi:hypothetical protein
MFYITDSGIVYELSRSQYKKLLREIAKGNPYTLSNFGKVMGHLSDVSDLTTTQATERLRRMGAE